MYILDASGFIALHQGALKQVLVSQNKTIIKINTVCMCSSTTYASINEDRSSIMNMDVRNIYNREMYEQD